MAMDFNTSPPQFSAVLEEATQLQMESIEEESTGSELSSLGMDPNRCTLLQLDEEQDQEQVVSGKNDEQKVESNGV